MLVLTTYQLRRERLPMSVIRRYRVGEMNDNGERLCEFISTHGMVTTGTIFPHKEVHMTTWRSTDRTENQIYHVLISGQTRQSVLVTRCKQ